MSRPIRAVPVMKAALSEEQILKIFEEELTARLQRSLIEKKVFGDIQGRILSTETLERYGYTTPSRSMTLLGLRPELRLKAQLESIPTREFLKDFREAVKKLPLSNASREKLNAAFLNFVEALKAEIRS